MAVGVGASRQTQVPVLGVVLEDTGAEIRLSTVPRRVGDGAVEETLAGTETETEKRSGIETGTGILGGEIESGTETGIGTGTETTDACRHRGGTRLRGVAATAAGAKELRRGRGARRGGAAGMIESRSDHALMLFASDSLPV